MGCNDGKNEVKHQFALYVDSLIQEPGSLQPGSLFTISDAELVHRMTVVLRLHQGEELTLFDRRGNAQVVITEIAKKKITCSVQSYQLNVQLKPSITVLLPVLKREAFEEAIYTTVELGATVVQPVLTEKGHRSWGGEKESERMQRIMIAAAEQSKNFSIPVLNEPGTLQQAVTSVASMKHKIFFDPSGQPVLNAINVLRQEQPETLVCAIGPEGDLSEQEKSLLKEQGFNFYALTPTILRAQQALVVGLGGLRLL